MTKEEVIQEDDFYLDITDKVQVFDGFKENEKRPEDKKMRVYVKPLSGADLYMINSRTKSELRDYMTKNPEDNFMDMFEFFNDKWTFITRIEKIENFFYKEEGSDEVKEFKTAKELFEYKSTATFNLVTQLFVYFNKIDRLNLKNS